MNKSVTKNKTGRRLYVEPMCGLCNRMRVIDGAITLGGVVGADVSVIWFCDDDLNCSFHDLFAPLAAPTRIINLRVSKPLELTTKRILHGIAKRFSSVMLDPDEVERQTRDGFDFRTWAQQRRTFIRTWTRFEQSPHPFAIFRPIQRLQSRIDEFASQLTQAIGIHLRRADSPWQKETPTEMMIARMRHAIDTNLAKIFFLATDDIEEEKYLRTIFPDKILSYPKRTLARSRKEGIEDAIIDLYLLGSCQEVYGTSRSSFSETAADIIRTRKTASTPI